MSSFQIGTYSVEGNDVFAEKGHVGRAATCPACLYSIEIPFHGEVVESVFQNDLNEAVQDRVLRKCRMCSIKVLVGIRVCPNCAAADPT